MPGFVSAILIRYHRKHLHKRSPILFDEHGRLRSGWRACVFLFAFIFVSIIVGSAQMFAFSALKFDATHATLLVLGVTGFLSLISALSLGWVCGRLFERLPFRAIGAAFTKGWLKHFLAGCLIGAVTLSFAVLIALVFGGERFELGLDNGFVAVISSLGLSLVVFAAAAAFEEALFRGYLLQTFARSGLAWPAIVITSISFGAVHLGNPDVTKLAILNTILSGLWFSLAYLKTRDLWFVWGLHLMWNWMQGSIFGIEVSGLTKITYAPLFREIDAGPIWLTGDSYGIEGGIVCTIAILISIAAIWFLPNLKPDPEMIAMTSPPTEH